MTWTRSIVAVFAVAAFWASAADRAGAQEPLERALDMAANAKLAAKKVGKLTIPVALEALMEGTTAAGSWSALDDDGVRFSGSYAAQGSSGRKFSVQLDAESLERLANVLEDHVSDKTGIFAHVVGIVQRPALLSFNKKQTKAKLKLVFDLTAEVDGVIRTGKYKLGLKSISYDR